MKQFMHKIQHQTDPVFAVTDGRLGAHQASRPRRGALLIELVVGCVLLGVFFASAIPLITWVRNAHHTTDSQRIAADELTNQMEQIAAMPVDDRTADSLRQLSVSESTLASLSDASLTAAMQPSTRFPEMQRITLSLSWTDRSGKAVRPLELTAWFAREVTAQSD